MSGDPLTFPWTEAPPPGTARKVADGVYWLVTTLPFRLAAINLWLIDDGDGWTMVDCGFPLPDVRAQIERVWADFLDGRPVHRLIVTHHHPDHLGNCRWICDRWGIVPHITAPEYARGGWFMDRSWEKDRAAFVRFYEQHGLSGTQGAEVRTNWTRYRDHFTPLPPTYHPLEDGQSLAMGGRSWTVMVGHGHSPAQALLHCPEAGLLISGDQILPAISPNVSVFHDAPADDPLSGFLASNRRIAAQCAPDILVLPSHRLPFRGLHVRVAELEDHHRDRLAQLAPVIAAAPRSAMDVLPTLFRTDKLDGHQLGFALGEAVAHLNHLLVQGGAVLDEREGLIRYRARQATSGQASTPDGG